jgi:hypothetical protein
MKMKDEIYVVVAENDITGDPEGPLVIEQYLRDATLQNAKKRAELLEPVLGKCRIAKVIFDD